MSGTAATFRRVVNWRYFDWAVLACLVAVITITNFVWRSVETRPPHWDMGRHLWISLIYLNQFKHLQLWQMIVGYNYYPPLFYCLTIPFYLLFGINMPAAVLSNVLFIAILAASTYGLGRRLWNRQTGLLAAVLVLCSPMLTSQFKEYQLDAPFTAMITLTLYLVVRSEEFTNRRFSMLLGLVLGIDLLTKWTAPGVLFLPVGVSAAIGLYRAYKTHSSRPLINLLSVTVIAYIIASPWYLTNLHQIKIDLLQNGITAGALEGDPPVGTLASNLWYFWNLVNNQLYLLPSLLFAIGLLWSFRSKQWGQNLYPLPSTLPAKCGLGRASTARPFGTG